MSLSLTALSFRWKLFLAMMLVVTAVAGGALLVTQQAVAATYAKIFRERFRAEADLFSAAQDARLAAVKDKCLELARSVRLVAAFEESDAALLYTIAFDELRKVMSPDVGLRALRPATFFRLIDRGGAVLPPPDARAGVLDRAAVEPTKRALSTAARAMGENETQAFGYLALAGPERSELHEVVLTRIVDPVRRRPLGALAIGFPLVESPVTGASTLVRSALWVGGELHSRALSEAARRQVSGELARRTATASGEWRTAIGGVPQQVLFRALPRGDGFPLAEQVSLYSLAEPLAEEARLRRLVLAFGALGLAAALVLSLQISRGLSVPIRELVAATSEIQRGNFSIQVPVRARDEVGRLAGSFNEMATGLELKERYRSLLDLVADKQVASELLSGGFALGGELREVTVLFCDIRGFTALTEQMSPTDVVELVNEHMTAMTAIVYEHRGVVDKFVGDLVMALFGAPKSYGEDALSALRCARGMVAARQRLNATSRHRLEVGIGVASGMVVAGRMGSSDRLSYSVLGERVNLASRLCSAAGPMEILVDETTYLHIGSEIGADPLPGLTLRGFSGLMPAFRVRPESGAP
ncbi:MAG: adenylate/guanylate cyclase domain-containing protein [Candidatus Binatia bacterium]